jgi:cyclic pyranopterin phosphate synthase
MVNITHKSSTLRKAVATAVVKTSSEGTMSAIRNHTVPKGDVFEFSRAAGLLAIKKTSDVIPDCHPLPVEYASIQYRLEDLSIIISVEVHTIYKTGVEVEAMHGAAVTALVIYDMLKPIDKTVEISTVRLQEKTGGKSEIKKVMQQAVRSAVVVCSDSVSSGKKQDTAGKAIVAELEKFNIPCERYEIIPDEVEKIQSITRELKRDGFRLVIFTGGTGVSPRDVTPDAIRPLLTKELPGVMEAARSYGQSRTRYSMLSRGVAGFIDDMLVLTLPGSRSGAEETMNALFPPILHLFEVADGARHD